MENKIVTETKRENPSFISVVIALSTAAGLLFFLATHLPEIAEMAK